MFYLVPMVGDVGLKLARRADTWVALLRLQAGFCCSELCVRSDSFLLSATTSNCIRGYPFFFRISFFHMSRTMLAAFFACGV